MKIQLEDLTKSFPGRGRNSSRVTAVKDFNFKIPDGELIGLLGPSGCGKSTTLNMICGLEKPTSGKIFFGDKDVTALPPEKRGVGMVFQNYALYPHLTVRQNIIFPLQNLKGKDKLSRAEMEKRAMDAAALVQIQELMERKPGELSGGQQQRVAIARAYVNHPQILLADEPTGNLDPTTSLGIMEVLDAINRTGTTIVMATHNEEIVNSMRKRVIELHTGKIVRDEAQGSYDSAEFFPDSDVASKAHEAISGQSDDSRFRPDSGSFDAQVTTIEARGEEGAVEGIEVVAKAVSGNIRNEGIARLASSVHSGRTGRYGEAFQSVEDTLTWGKGLSLEQIAAQEEQKARAEQGGDEHSDAAAQSSDRATARDDARSAQPEDAAQPERHEPPEPPHSADGAAPHGQPETEHPQDESTSQSEQAGSAAEPGSSSDEGGETKPRRAHKLPPAPPAQPGHRDRHAGKAGSADDADGARNEEDNR